MTQSLLKIDPTNNTVMDRRANKIRKEAAADVVGGKTARNVKLE
jgi:hypothetical protein